MVILKLPFMKFNFALTLFPSTEEEEKNFPQSFFLTNERNVKKKKIKK